MHTAGAPVSDPKAIAASANDLFNQDSLNIRHHWPQAQARALGLLGSEEDPVAIKTGIDATVQTLKQIADNWGKGGSNLAPPPPPTATRSIKLEQHGFIPSKGKKKSSTKILSRIAANGFAPPVVIFPTLPPLILVVGDCFAVMHSTSRRGCRWSSEKATVCPKNVVAYCPAGRLVRKYRGANESRHGERNAAKSQPGEIGFVRVDGQGSSRPFGEGLRGRRAISERRRQGRRKKMA